jgi:carbon monoxide dehydrogenase subunit G
MDLEGRYAIPARPEAVWAALNDPEVLKFCIPGCQQIEKTSPTEFNATATLKIGPVKATFRGKVSLSDLEPPHRCRLTGEGQGGVAGFARGDADVLLTPEGDGTVLTYAAKASVGGKLAQIGQRLVDGAARQIADEFFGRFSQALTAARSEPVLEPDPLTTREPPAGSPAKPIIPLARERFTPEIWVVGLIGVIVILLLIFGTVL